MKHILVALFAVVLTVGLAAQTPDTATLRGHVADASASAVPGATITVVDAQLGLTRSVTSDASGAYSLAGLPIAGTYKVTVTKAGFATAQQDQVTLVGGATATMDLKLNVAEGHSIVMVTGDAGGVRSDEPQLGDHLTAKQIAEVPLFNNQITYLPLLNSANRPAINMGDVFMNENLITTNGSGRRQTSFVVDGANANDSWGRQTIFSNVPVSAVQEMTVLENAFSAEYGSTTGGVVNIVTKSGGQNFHGELLYATRPNGMAAHLSGYTQATASSGNQQLSDEFNQAAWAVSGPIGQKTQFYVAGESNYRDRTSPVISPVDPTNYVGHYRDGLMFARLDHQINANNSLFARADVDSFYDTNPNGIVGGNALPTVARVFQRKTYSGELGETAVLSPTLVNTARLQFQLADPITEFDPVNFETAYAVPISGLQTFTSGTSSSAKLINHQFEGNDTMSAVLGRHSIKFGFDATAGYDGGNSKEFGGPSFLGTFTFNTCGPTIPGNSTPTSAQLLAYCESPAYLQIGNVASYSQSFGNANYKVDDNLYSLFVQDDFHATRNLTLNLGLRYERQTFTDANKNFAPRVGFAYSPWGSATVIRGGYGLYYSQVVDNSEANYALTGPTGVFTFNAAKGQAGFPTTLAPYSSLPSGAATPLRSLYLRPGMASYYNQFFPTSTLVGYQSALLNPISAQGTFGIEHKFSHDWVLSADYVGAHTTKINRPLDVDAPAPFVRTAQNQNRTAAAANATRPLWIYDAAHGITPAYSVIQSDVNDGIAWYDALELNLNHRFSSRFQALASYTYSHTLDTVDPDATGQNPNDPNFTGLQEKGNALYDQRHRFVLSGTYQGPWGINLGGVTTLASGLAYNLTTGATNGGDTGAETDRPVINGVVVARNSGRGTPIYSVDPFVERNFPLREKMNLNLRAESFDFLNHANYVGFNGTYGNTNTTAPATLGAPSVGVTSQLQPREFQFSAKFTF